ncbi:50S ribosomal protein L22 [Candidatus Uhrbacteria bacterium RIFCSPHIGHO2_12_FULL_54_23]|uniref:Large ribosomal subunit protein uL22 n=4 Tax=Candidatus Uhriibacteriota TaxID=1752732 RepID=A0A1F7UI80_9BACT|nr:MAG: 50S ribosomal protein L22 [Candidatus Uhrbacteria bacterium RIFCSPHIGHO2_12_FULL_54_23]OGL83631.1 MAG: 50S ribosomal protein L22 [Candidatus Uhrbacteria bacterium RIFCSPLOWO2_01_FULL_55_36]OGL90002.1 MAG: 50S ribosomal protein L22 [Candidatus Uhrbacteria bacterium RIFCSPLOWO2_02_FULL_54_37]
MDVSAQLRFLRHGPRKVRLLADMVRGLDVQKAVSVLLFDPHHPARALKKLIESAAANARHNFQLDAANLYVKQIRVDGGPVLKRMFPRAMGRGAPIRRRTSHITVILGERVARSGKKEEKEKSKQ